MLDAPLFDGLDRNVAQKLSATLKTASPLPSVTTAAEHLATAPHPVYQDAVIVSISSSANTPAEASAPSATDRANQQADRGLEALGHIADAKAKSATTMKQFLRHKLDALKKQMEILRILGRNALDIAKGSVSIAREVAKSCRDYAAATNDEKAAGTSTADTTEVTDKEAQKQAEDLQAKAAKDALTNDPASDNPAGAPKDPDERFFYDAFRLLRLVKKTLREAQQVDTRQYGLKHAKDFKKLNHREHDLEQAVVDAYKAMKTGGDLKAVDAALTKDANSADNTNILA